MRECKPMKDMAGLAPERSQYGAHQGSQEKERGGIFAYDFGNPSAIQQSGIGPSCHVILHAPYGLRRTLIFCSGILAQLDSDLVECQALVLAPTRELINRTKNVMRGLHDYLCHVKVHACIGDIRATREDRRVLSSGVHVIVATPECVFDMLKRQHLRPDHIKMFVLDGLDEMLSRGFKDKIYDIYQLLPSNVRVGIFSGTMPPEALEIRKKFMNHPIRNLEHPHWRVIQFIRQFYFGLGKEERKLLLLCELYETLAITQGVIFVNTRPKVVWLSDEMRRRGHTVSAIHGHMDQNARDIVLHEFHSGSSRVLITTDHYARGIDVPQFSVVNYDMPVEVQHYLHRIRCGGRFSRKGVVISFVICEGGRDLEMLGDIQVFTGVVIERMPSKMAKLL